MRYSVWNQSARLYDYFEDSVPERTANAPPPKHLSSATLGLSPHEASWPLPLSARRTGSGAYPIGRICRGSAPAGLGDVDVIARPVMLLAAAGIAIVLLSRKRGRR